MNKIDRGDGLRESPHGHNIYSYGNTYTSIAQKDQQIFFHMAPCVKYHQDHATDQSLTPYHIEIKCLCQEMFDTSAVIVLLWLLTEFPTHGKFRKMALRPYKNW